MLLQLLGRQEMKKELTTESILQILDYPIFYRENININENQNKTSRLMGISREGQRQYYFFSTRMLGLCALLLNLPCMRLATLSLLPGD